MISLQYVRGRSLPELLHDFLHAEGARPLRFVVSGAPTAGTQLGLLALLVHSGWPALAANGLAVAITAQLSFVLSHWFTWRGRNVSRSLVGTWMMFHASISGTVALNLLVCAAGTLVVPLPLASLAGIAAAAIGNFASGDRLIFRHQPGGPAVALAEQIAA
jgi:putative flippase GtrA